LPEYFVHAYDLLYRRNPDGLPTSVVPESLVTRLISEHHDAKHAVHARIQKTQNRMRARYYWPNLHRDVDACRLWVAYPKPRNRET
jgi:hypothetical protein